MIEQSWSYIARRRWQLRRYDSAILADVYQTADGFRWQLADGQSGHEPTLVKAMNMAEMYINGKEGA